MKGNWWNFFVWISSVSMVILIIDTMKKSIHLYLSGVPEEGCGFIALGLYCVSLFGALALMCCNDKELCTKEKIIMATVGICILVPIGIFLCLPICAHAFIYRNVGTLHNNAYYFWLSNYDNANTDIVHWCLITVLLFLASYIGFRLIFNQLKPYFIN